MFNLKGFIRIAAFARNAPNNVSPLGELSDQSNSYSKEKGEYTKTDAPNVDLVTFTSKEDDLKIETPTKYHSHILDIAQWVFTESISGAINDDSEHFRQMFLAEWQNDIGDVVIGKMVAKDANWMPSFIKWDMLDGDNEENSLHIWFADDAFKTQYDDYEIVVVAPVEPVDTFMKTIDFVGPALDAFNLPDHDEKAARLADGHPYTIRDTNDYPWYDREDKDQTRNTSWTVLIYGIAGNNPLIIKEALAEWILANSQFPRADWIHVFPDIFTSTEFAIIPTWHLKSIPDENPRGEMYSPLIPHNEAKRLADKYIKYPKDGHVDEFLTSGLIHYKSLGFITAGGIENRDGKFWLKDFFPQYAAIPVRSGDFNRMDKYHTDWIKMLLNAVIAAEEMDEYSYLDLEYAKVEKDGRLYVGFSYDNILFLVLSRLSMDEITNPEPEPTPEPQPEE